MTIVRSLGVTTLVMLMSTHRCMLEKCSKPPKPSALAMATADAFDGVESLDWQPFIEPLPSCN